jgi:hypothetical protein
VASLAQHGSKATLLAFGAGRPGRPDICGGFPLVGHLLVLPGPATHDGGVSSTVQAAPTRAVGETSMTDSLVPDLEEFWPSRRGHAFDELCR